MSAKIFLIAPEQAEPIAFAAALRQAFKTGPIAALLLPQGSRDHASYEALVGAVLPITQKHECALLLDGHIAMARRLGADGVHLATGQGAFKQATQDLQPELIVGAGTVQTRDDAMNKGEAGADYIFFGDPLGRPNPDMIEMAKWWGETFEVPCVVKLPNDADPKMHPGEFIALGPRFWDEPTGMKRLENLHATPQDTPTTPQEDQPTLGEKAG